MNSGKSRGFPLKKSRPALAGEIIFLVLSAFPGLLLSGSEIPFHLTVRRVDGETAFPALKTEDFRLMIDGDEAKILSAAKKRRSLALESDLGREFILSFKAYEFGSAIERDLSTFLSEILKTSDSLYILTPEQLFHFDVSVNKGSLLRRIREVLEKDCRAFREERISTESRLKRDLNGAVRVLEEDPQGFEIYRQMNLFLNVFPEQFRRYKKRFLVPDPKRFDEVLAKLGFGEGERWWIHFEEYHDPGLSEKVQAVIRDMNDHIAELGQAQQNLAEILKTNVIKLEESLSLSDAFPSKDLVRVLAAHDVVFHAVFFRGDSLKEAGIESAPFLNLAALYGETASASGGAAVNIEADTRGIAAVVSHVDEYFDLTFAWAGPDEKARLRVLAGGSEEGLRYAEVLTRAQFDARAKLFSPEKIRIDEIAVAEGKLNFVVKSYQRSKDGDFGLIKIKVALLNGWNQSMFQEERTMRATKETISISIPLAGSLPAVFRISITACDMLANRMTIEERSIDPGRPPFPIIP